jgi:hypothetical protein
LKFPTTKLQRDKEFLFFAEHIRIWDETPALSVPSWNPMAAWEIFMLVTRLFFILKMIIYNVAD